MGRPLLSFSDGKAASFLPLELEKLKEVRKSHTPLQGRRHATSGLSHFQVGYTNDRVPIQLAKKSLEKPLEKPLEISYTGKTQKMGSLDMPQNQICISSGFSNGFLAN